MADTVTGVAKGQPTFYGLIVDAIVNLKQPKGCSRQSILGYLFATNKLKDSRQTRRSVAQSIERNIRNGSLVKAGKTSYIKLAEKACGFKESIKRTGKGNNKSIPKKRCVKGENTGAEKKRKQHAKTRTSAKPSDTDTIKKHRKHEKATDIRRSRNTLGTPKQTEKKTLTKRNKGRKEAKTKEKTVKHVTTQRKKNRTGTKQVEQTTKKANTKNQRTAEETVEHVTTQRKKSRAGTKQVQKTKKENTKNQRKTRLASRKTGRGQGKSIGPKTKAPSSSSNTQLPVPRVDDVTVDTSTQTPDITARLLQTIPIDTEAKRFFNPKVEVYAVTVTNDGRKLIAEKSGLIQLYSPDFKLTSCLQLKNAKPYDIAIYSENEVVVATGGLLYLIDFSRNVLTIAYTFFETPYHVSKVTSCRDDIFVACLRDSRNSVKKIDSTGNVYWTTEFDQPLTVTSYTKGEKIVVAVTEDSKCTLTLLEGETGEVLAVRQLQMLYPRGCTADSLGNIYLFYAYSNTIRAVSFTSADLSMEKNLSATKTGKEIYPKADSYDLGLNTYPVSICWDETRHQLLVAVFS